MVPFEWEAYRPRKGSIGTYKNHDVDRLTLASHMDSDKISLVKLLRLTCP